MDMSSNPSSSSSSIVTVEGMIIQLTCILLPTLFPAQTDSPVPDEVWRSRRIAECLQNLNGRNFIEYMDEIGWPQDGAFKSLLSTVCYHFDEKDGRMVIRDSQAWADPGASLSVLILEL